MCNNYFEFEEFRGLTVMKVNIKSEIAMGLSMLCLVLGALILITNLAIVSDGNVTTVAVIDRQENLAAGIWLFLSGVMFVRAQNEGRTR
jgi:hypothetical protein